MINNHNEFYSKLALMGITLRGWAKANDYKAPNVHYAVNWIGKTGEPKGKTADIIHKLEQTLNTEIYKRPNYTGEKVG